MHVVKSPLQMLLTSRMHGRRGFKIPQPACMDVMVCQKTLGLYQLSLANGPYCRIAVKLTPAEPLVAVEHDVSHVEFTTYYEVLCTIVLDRQS